MQTPKIKSSIFKIFGEKLYLEKKKHKNDDTVFPAGPYDFKFNGLDYVNSWVMPNLYFHITTAYNILRHNGVDLGKLDYLGAIAEK